MIPLEKLNTAAAVRNQPPMATIAPRSRLRRAAIAAARRETPPTIASARSHPPWSPRALLRRRKKPGVPEKAPPAPPPNDVPPVWPSTRPRPLYPNARLSALLSLVPLTHGRWLAGVESTAAIHAPET